VAYLLDTNAIIALLKRSSPGHVERLRATPPQSVFWSSIVAFELYYGAYKSLRVADNLATLAGLALEPLAFDLEDARAAGHIRATLAQAGQPIGPYDVLIAGQALARDMVLITRNTREFARVPDLRVEDWEM
jgi:tRNA(fMet)-specific endonuclease VapC